MQIGMGLSLAPVDSGLLTAFVDNVVGTPGQQLGDRDGWTWTGAGFSTGANIADDGQGLDFADGDNEGSFFLTNSRGGAQGWVDVSFTNEVQGFAILCWINTTNYLGVRRHLGNTEVFERIGGVFTNLSTVAYTDLDEIVRLELIDTTEVNLYHGGVLVDTFSVDISFADTERAGLVARRHSNSTERIGYFATSLTPPVLSFSNGDFSAGKTPWGAFRRGVGRDDSWLDVSSGRAVVTAGGSGEPPIIAQRINGLIVGETYQVTYERFDGGGSVDAYVGFWTEDYSAGNTGPANSAFTNFDFSTDSALGVHSHDWVATQDWAWVGVRRSAISASLEVDNFSLVKL